MNTALERKLQVIFDVHQYPLSAAEERLLHDSLDALARQVEHFPLADLHVLIEGNARSNDVSVKLTLHLPGTKLLANDHDVAPQPAFQRCLDSLIDSLQAYKDQLGQVPERHKAGKGTRQQLHPSLSIDEAALKRAAEAGDYTEFRTALLPFEEGLRKRVGRWVQRYPDVQAEVDRTIKIADIVEEVLLQAFDGYLRRPDEIALGDWLERLIDPAVQTIRRKGDQELEHIALARSATGAER